MKKKLTALVAVVAMLASLAVPVACTPTQRGAAIGAGAGALGGALLSGKHKTTRGAAIGAVAGGLIGGVIGHTYEINKYCPNCGRRFHRSKDFCSHCGSQLQTIGAPSTGTTVGPGGAGVGVGGPAGTTPGGLPGPGGVYEPPGGYEPPPPPPPGP